MACDIWSLAITVIEVAEGYPPHLADKTPMAAMMAIARSPPPTLQQATPSWSKQFKGFVSKLLNKRPDHRPDVDKVLDHPFLAKLDELVALGEMLDVLRELYPKRQDDIEPVWSPVRSQNPLSPEPDPHFSSPAKATKPVPVDYADVDNLSTLAEVDEKAILAVLRHRFNADRVFTSVGNILVSVNPFKQVPAFAPGKDKEFRDPQVRHCSFS